jgi:septum formation topological specificity factor MinE
MLYLTYIEPLYHSKDSFILNNSSGHILLDVFSTFIFGILLDAKVIYHESWSLSKIIEKDSWLHYCDKPLNHYDYVLTIDNIRNWKGLSINEFENLKNNILNVSQKYDNVLIKFTNVCKIHAHQLHIWYKNDYLKTDIYSEKIIPILKNLYYFKNNKDIINQFAIHIRRGDLATQLINTGYTYNYYKNIIDIINKYLNINIVVYCENWKCDDIKKLSKLKNTTLDLGNLPEFNKQFNELCRSKYLFLSPSSFSIFTGYLSNGIVIGDEKLEKFRSNIFNDLKLTPNFNIVNNIAEFENFIKTLQ